MAAWSPAAPLGHKDLKDLKAMQVPLDSQVLQDHKDHKDHKAMQVPLVLKELPDSQEPQELADPRCSFSVVPTT